MTLIKTSLLNSIAVGIRILTSLVLNKVFAVYVGPTGFAIIGQFQNFVGMLTMAIASINPGVTKYTAEFFDDDVRRRATWRTAGTATLGGGLLLGAVIALLHQKLAVWILKDQSLEGVFVWLGATLVFFLLNGLLLAIVNGRKEFKLYVAVNITSSLAGLAISGVLATKWGLYGALVAQAINQSVIFAVSLALCWRTPWFRLRDMVGRIDPGILKALGAFSIMGLVSAFCIPIAQLLIRNHLGEAYGWEAAGRWEALNRISALYLMLVTTPLAVYYLPRISEIRGMIELRMEILNGYRIILPVAAAGALSIYLLRDWLVITLFSVEFLPMRDLFAWQMAGDVVKIGSWLLAYVMVGKALVAAFVVTEILFSASWVGLVWLMTHWLGEGGAQIGYFANYVLYLCAMIFILIRITSGDKINTAKLCSWR